MSLGRILATDNPRWISNYNAVGRNIKIDICIRCNQYIITYFDCSDYRCIYTNKNIVAKMRCTDFTSTIINTKRASFI